jgi:PAS domain S-box-containing protein
MFDFLTHLLDTSDFPTRWHCGNWTVGHAWLHILSDLGVWSAYVAIPCVLGYFVLRRKDIPFRTVFLLFGAFILACGTTHLMEALIFWWPAYRLAGVIKLVTALVSWGTVLALVPVTPQALAMRGPEELEREIAARKEAERALEQANAELQHQVEALRASEERFRLLVEGTRDYAIFMLDSSGHIVSWNPGAQRIKQYQAEEIIGEHFSRFYPMEDVQAGKPEQELRVAATEGRYEEEGWKLRKDGSRFWANVIITALRDQAGSLRGFSKITRDMTERKQAEENARRLVEEAAARRAAEEHTAVIWEERERLRVTLHSIGDGVIATDAEGRVTLLNPVAEALTGWKNDEAAQQPLPEIFSIINEQTRQEVENPVTKALREGHIVGLANHTILIDKRGQERPIDDSAAPIKDAQGETVGVVLVFRDVTEKRAAEIAVQTSEERLSLAQDVAGLGLWDWDIRTGEVVWNTHHERIFGYPPGQPKRTYRDFADRIPRTDLDQIEAGFRLAMQENRDYRFEHRVVWPDGTTRWVEASGRFHFDAAGQPVRSVGVLMDLTERKQAEQALQEADRRKNEFLATLAHELRNPLAPIRSGLHMLRLNHQPSAQDQTLEMLDRQVAQLVRLVDDLLDINRITHNKLELRKACIPLASVIANAVESARPFIESRGHTLTVTLPPQPVYLDADLIRLAQAFWNLLNNSAKYTDPNGRIDLCAQVQGSEVVVTVRDAGIGIPAEALPNLFTLFSQLDHSLERAQGGLGIGLALVKGLVEMHGGAVAAHSDGIGKGSTFTVRLPVVPEPRQEQESPTIDNTAGAAKYRVLVVDDNRDAAASLAMLLALGGHDARTAHDGIEALEFADAFRPHVILLDIGLPKLNGYDTCRRIREQPWGKDILIAAITGWGQEDDRLRSQEAGFNQHLVKPVDLTTLEKLLAGLPPAPPQSASARDPVSGQPPAPTGT